jgi:hypothetical protein
MNTDIGRLGYKLKNPFQENSGMDFFIKKRSSLGDPKIIYNFN